MSFTTASTSTANIETSAQPAAPKRGVYVPAGKDRNDAILPTPEEVAQVFAAHGMTVVGPSLQVG